MKREIDLCEKPVFFQAWTMGSEIQKRKRVFLDAL